MSLAGKVLVGIFASLTVLAILATVYNGLVREGFMVITDVTTE